MSRTPAKLTSRNQKLIFIRSWWATYKRTKDRVRAREIARHAATAVRWSEIQGRQS